MVAARASAVAVIVAGGWALAGVAFGQQPASTIVPAVATIETSMQPPGVPAPGLAAWMPSRLAGHLADRLQALHEPVAVAEASPVVHEAAAAGQLEAAARTPPGPGHEALAAIQPWQPSATVPPPAASPAAQRPAELKPAKPKPAASKPATSPATQISIVAPQPAAAPPHNSLPRRQPEFGAINPLRGNR